MSESTRFACAAYVQVSTGSRRIALALHNPARSGKIVVLRRFLLTILNASTTLSIFRLHAATGIPAGGARTLSPRSSTSRKVGPALSIYSPNTADTAALTAITGVEDVGTAYAAAYGPYLYSNVAEATGKAIDMLLDVPIELRQGETLVLIDEGSSTSTYSIANLVWDENDIRNQVEA